jgi:hypothetical protein
VYVDLPGIRQLFTRHQSFPKEQRKTDDFLLQFLSHIISVDLLRVKVVVAA